MQFTCSINNGFTGYVRKRKRNEVQVYATIKPKGLSQRFDGCCIFTLTDRASIIPCNIIRGCQSGTVRGHKEVPRSTGHIMVTTRYSDQQGSKLRQKLCDFTSNGTDQYQNGSSNILTPYREQPRSTRIVIAYPRPAFSTTKRTNYAPTSFDQQVQVSQGHKSYKNKKT